MPPNFKNNDGLVIRKYQNVVVVYNIKDQYLDQNVVITIPYL